MWAACVQRLSGVSGAALQGRSVQPPVVQRCVGVAASSKMPSGGPLGSDKSGVGPGFERLSA